MVMEKLHNFIICFIMMCVHLSAGEEIEIAVLVGKNTTLPCTFEGKPSHVTWFKGEKRPGKSFAEYRDSKIEYRETIDTDRYRVQKNSSFSLTIADVEIADAGRYSCAVTVDGVNFPSLYHLKILVPPEPPYPRIVPMIPDSDGGQPVNLTCHADGGSIGLVNLHWIYSDTRSIQRDTKSYPNTDGTTENVTSVIVAYPSEKPYTCVATLNTSGKESATAFVNIRPLHRSTPITPKPTVPTTRRNETTTDDTGSVNSRPDAWKITVGVMIPVGIAVFVFLIWKFKQRPVSQQVSLEEVNTGKIVKDDGHQKRDDSCTLTSLIRLSGPVDNDHGH